MSPPSPDTGLTTSPSPLQAFLNSEHSDALHPINDLMPPRTDFRHPQYNAGALFAKLHAFHEHAHALCNLDFSEHIGKFKPAQLAADSRWYLTHNVENAFDWKHDEP